MVAERFRKLQRPERAPGNCEIGGRNCGSEKVGSKPVKRGRKGKVLNNRHSGSDIGAAQVKEIEERKENRVSRMEKNMKTEAGESEIGEDSGEKVNKSEREVAKKENQSGSLHLVAGEEKENGENIEEEIERRVSNGERRIKFDDNCQVRGVETNGVSEDKVGSDGVTSLSGRRLRGVGKKVNYNEDEFEEQDDERVFGKKMKKRGRGQKVIQKTNKLNAKKVQGNDPDDKEGNEGVNNKKHGRKSKKNDKVEERVGLKSEDVETGNLEDESEGNGARQRGSMKRAKTGKESENLKSGGGGEIGDLKGNGGEGNKERQRGPNKQEKKVNEESTNEKDSSLIIDGGRYSLRASRTVKDQHVLLKDSNKKKVRTSSFLVAIMYSSFYPFFHTAFGCILVCYLVSFLFFYSGLKRNQ